MTFSALTLAGCQASRSAVATLEPAAASADSAAAVVLMHSSQGPEPMPTVVSAAEARELSASRARVERR